MVREINSIWDSHGTVYGTTSAVVFVCVGGGVTSVETRLSVPDFISQLWRKFGDKMQNRKPEFEPC